MKHPQQLQQALSCLLGDARLIDTQLPGSELRLWLLDPSNMQRSFSTAETQNILAAPPYWCFCWASGLAVANWLQQNPHWVSGKRVLDLGSGSGVVAIAAARAGAAQVLACDLDPLALAACQANAALNGVTLHYCADLSSAARDYDLLIAADLLYDRSNLPLLENFLEHAQQALVADSRIRDFQHPVYQPIASLQSCTWPDLAEPQCFRQVSLYWAKRSLC